MASRKRSSTPTESGSWMSLLAATSLGLETANTVRAEVRAAAPLREANYRLVVQTFDGASRAKPLSSVQRAVTAQELREGVQVSLFELGGRAAKPEIVAWIETGAPDLEFDGRMARPQAGSLKGTAQGAADVRILLTKRAA